VALGVRLVRKITRKDEAKMDRTYKNVLVTGGSGFIGSNFIIYMLGPSSGFEGSIVNADKLTYAGNPENLVGVDKAHGVAGDKRYAFERLDICDRASVEAILKKHDIDAIVHFAAESHVDRSIHGPEDFVRTNVMGTFTLLDAARTLWKDRRDVLFHHVSTDEVYGSLGETGYFTETTPYDPRSPYSASKAGSDHLVMAYSHTYGIPVTLTNCSNNYGPFQFPEKLIPLMISNMRTGKALPVYGDGKNIRDWLYVEDHNSAVWLVMRKAAIGEKYNIGGENEWENIKLLDRLIDIVSAETGKPVADIRSTLTYVKDRPGHDRRYAIDCSRIKRDLGWKQSFTFEEGLRKTVRWYLDNQEWVDNVLSGEYKAWVEKNYGKR
jgi:dTDP-glucose 4,6-dehydratase